MQIARAGLKSGRQYRVGATFVTFVFKKKRNFVHAKNVKKGLISVFRKNPIYFEIIAKTFSSPL